MDLLNLSRLERISNNICQVNYSSNLPLLTNAGHHTHTCRVRLKCSEEGTYTVLYTSVECAPTFSCSLASVYTVSLYSISFCSLSVNLQVNVHTVHCYSSAECVWAPQSGVFTEINQVAQIPTNIHSQFTEVYCSYLPDIPMVY